MGLQIAVNLLRIRTSGQNTLVNKTIYKITKVYFLVDDMVLVVNDSVVTDRAVHLHCTYNVHGGLLRGGMLMIRTIEQLSAG
jgi:hypothetical protein